MKYVVRKVMNGCGSSRLSQPSNKLMFCFKLAHAAREPQSINVNSNYLHRNIEKEHRTSNPHHVLIHFTLLNTLLKLKYNIH